MTFYFAELFKEVVLRRPSRRAIPALDGQWKANEKLETCPAFARGLQEADAIAAGNDGLVYAASGNTVAVLQSDGRLIDSIGGFQAPITALGWSESRGPLIAAEGLGVYAIPPGKTRELLGGTEALGCITAIAEADDTIYLAQGSTRNRYADWRRSLMEHDRSGRILRWEGENEEVNVLASGLAFPFGLAADGPANEELVFTEAWSYSIRTLKLATSGVAVGIDNLPGYPARIVADGQGGWFVSFLALRTQLVEFVLREPKFLRRMIGTVPQEFWIAPSLSPNDDHRQPQQLGLLRTHGVRKPWAPGRSYGLIAHFDRAFNVVSTLHSRADGERHGTLGLCMSGSRLLATTFAQSAILLPLGGTHES